jgi:hypothetical protein
MDPRIDEYIRSNRATYTREAIRAQLVNAGHDPADVDAAWDRVEAGPAPSGPVGWNARPPDGRGSALDASALPPFAMTLFLVGGIVGALGALLALGLQTSINGIGTNAVLFIAIYVAVYGGVGLGVIWLTRLAARRMTIRGVWVVLAGMALLPIFGFAMFGGCLAAFGVAGTGG